MYNYNVISTVQTISGLDLIWSPGMCRLVKLLNPSGSENRFNPWEKGCAWVVLRAVVLHRNTGCQFVRTIHSAVAAVKPTRHCHRRRRYNFKTLFTVIIFNCVKVTSRRIRTDQHSVLLRTMLGVYFVGSRTFKCCWNNYRTGCFRAINAFLPFGHFAFHDLMHDPFFCTLLTLGICLFFCRA